MASKFQAFWNHPAGAPLAAHRVAVPTLTATSQRRRSGVTSPRRAQDHPLLGAGYEVGPCQHAYSRRPCRAGPPPLLTLSSPSTTASDPVLLATGPGHRWHSRHQPAGGEAEPAAVRRYEGAARVDGALPVPCLSLTHRTTTAAPWTPLTRPGRHGHYLGAVLDADHSGELQPAHRQRLRRPHGLLPVLPHLEVRPGAGPDRGTPPVTR